VNEIDWMDIPMKNFSSAIRTQADGTTFQEWHPFGGGKAQRLVGGLSANVEDAYSRLLSEEDWERFETEATTPPAETLLRGSSYRCYNWLST
jgi:hypothetical protein